MYTIEVNKVVTLWGYYIDMHRSDNTVVKEICINPGHRFSYQYHSEREEFWAIHSGIGQLTLNGEVFTVKPGSSIDINKYDKHRLANIGDEPLIFFEIQSGKCSEEDIVRLSDDYGR